MPNRVIKDSIRTSKSVNTLTDFQFRLWLYLITYVDDYGRGSADAEILKGFVFPRRKSVTEAQIQRGLDDLATTGMIRLYEADGEPYFCFPNWDKHQRIQTKRSKYPDPEESTVIHREPPLESESKSESKSELESKERSTRFAPPSRSEAEDYCRENGITVNLDTWFAYYEQNGWRVGRDKMKSWKASLAYWQSKEKPEKKPMNMTARGVSPESAKEDMERMKKMLGGLK